MDTEEYRKQALKVIDFICEFKKNTPTFRVLPGNDIKANQLKGLLSATVPIDGESFDEILNDLKEKLMPRMLHWDHPNFHAYYPLISSFPSMLGDMLSSATNQLIFSWRSSPAGTEHEQIVLNMYAKALDLPKFFLYDENNESTGGGALQSSASDCLFLALLAARSRAIKILRGSNTNMHESIFLPQMVAYTSQEAHSSVQKAAKIAIIRVRILPTDENGVLRGETLAKAIEYDVQFNGFTPIFVSATLGTTGVCAFDRIDEIGEVCKKYRTIWYHVDGAYGGNSFILPEMRPFKRGLEHADSFSTNPNKLLLTTVDCSCFWVKSNNDLKDTMSVNPTYLMGNAADGEDLRYYGIPLSRRFRSLKLWCVMRCYGLRGLQAHIRNTMAMAKHFEKLVKSDSRFSLENEVHLGLVCFRLILPTATNEVVDSVNVEFLDRMNLSGEIHMVPTTFRDKYIIRYSVNNEKASIQGTEESWNTIVKHAKKVLHDYSHARLDFQQKGIRAPKSQFSLTRSISRENYETHKANPQLMDGSTAICVGENSDFVC